MPATLGCPRCSEPLAEGASACGHCGTAVHACAVCSGMVANEDRFCGQCGGPQGEAVPEPSPWDEVVERLRQATLGDFVILRELGRGGMAAVYLAHDIALNRKVAIKVMSPGLLMGPGMVERFKQEAVTVANLSHPHIVTIHAVRQMAGLHFFVMKLIPGRSVERIIKDGGPLPVPVVQALLFQVGSALAYAHRRGIIHRDIKPGNILLDEDGNAIVTDFGIAKVRESPTHTMTGATVGTPAYMSPEQCWSREVTGASDQYSLGIVAYEMLTGVPPFTGPTLGILRAHVEDTPRPITEIRPECPAEVAAAVERMMGKEPAVRWPDVMQAVTGLGGRHLPEHDPLREQLAALAMQHAAPDTSPAYRTPVSPVPTTVPPPAPPPPPAAPPAAPLTAVVVTGPTSRGSVGDSLQLQAEGRDARGQSRSGERLRWSSSNPAVATVSPGGVVTLLSEGSVTITASSDDGVAGATLLEVTAPAPPSPTPAPASTPVSAAPPAPPAEPPPPVAEPVAAPGAGPVLPQRARGPLAAALAAAAVLALAVWLWPEGGGRPAPPPVASIIVSPATGRLAPGDSLTVTASTLAADGALLRGRPLIWRSSDSTVATVSPAGVVVARAPGAVQVMVTSEGQEARAALRVDAPGPAGDDRVAVVIAGGPERPVTVRDSFTLKAVVTGPDGAPRPEAAVRWRSSRPAVASVSAEGTVTAMAEGSATITASADGGEGSMTVRVNPPAVAGVVVSPPRGSGSVGDTLQLTATMVSTGGDTLRGKVAVWESGNRAVATVGPGGAVALVGPGSAVITATSGGVRGSATVTATGTRTAVTAVEIAPAAERLEVGQSLRLNATVRGARGVVSDRPVTWRSSRPEVAAVGPDGTVTGRAAGEAQITATSEAASASVTLTVVAGGPPPAGGGAGGFRAIAAGGMTCALNSAGSAACWGQGQAAPAPVGGGPFTSIVTGQGFACGLTAGGQAHCWGSNGKGQLGDGSTKSRATPTLVSADLSFGMIAAGDAHACGLTTGGNIYCWGDNGQGQLGDGSKSNRQRPTQIRETQPWKQVVAGGIHSCGLTREGRAYCWGDGFSGELGHGMMESSLEPVPVTGGLTFTSLTAGRRHTCGLTAGKEAYCWGDNREGQLGGGGREDTARPAVVAGELQFSSLSAGAGHTCGVTAGGRAMCWGANGAGQVGDGGKTNRTAPAAVRSESVFLQVSAGTTHSCGITREQAALCWGGNNQGQLGDGTRLNKGVPTPVAAPAGAAN